MVSNDLHSSDLNIIYSQHSYTYIHNTQKHQCDELELDLLYLLRLAGDLDLDRLLGGERLRGGDLLRSLYDPLGGDPPPLLFSLFSHLGGGL